MVVPAATVGVAIKSYRHLYRELLATWVAAEPGFTVVGHVGEDADLLELCALLPPDLVLVDVGADLATALPVIVALQRRSGVTVLTLYDRLAPSDLAAARRAGVRHVPCSLGLDAFRIVLRECGAAGHGDAGTGPGRGGKDSLTLYERDVISLVATGHTVARIAALLRTSASAIEHCKRRIYAKLRVVSQSHVVARAAALGILDPGPGGLPGVPEELPDLTLRESQILRSISAGDTVRQTARSLGITEKTVENTQTRLFRKLGCRNRAAALARAAELGLLDQAAPEPDAGVAADSAGASGATVRRGRPSRP